jgi:hypothetical protein
VRLSGSGSGSPEAVLPAIASVPIGVGAVVPPLAGMRDIASSVIAVIVRDGFTPTLAGIAAPSQTRRFS